MQTAHRSAEALNWRLSTFASSIRVASLWGRNTVSDAAGLRGKLACARCGYQVSRLGRGPTLKAEFPQFLVLSFLILILSLNLRDWGSYLISAALAFDFPSRIADSKTTTQQSWGVTSRRRREGRGTIAARKSAGDQRAGCVSSRAQSFMQSRAASDDSLRMRLFWKRWTEMFRATATLLCEQGNKRGFRCASQVPRTSRADPLAQLSCGQSRFHAGDPRATKGLRRQMHSRLPIPFLSISDMYAGYLAGGEAKLISPRQ